MLFDPISLRSLTSRNRIWVSPMCQYSAVDGLPQSWHLVHLGTRAVGGAGLVIAEATAVSPEGRISPQDTGIWSDAHTEAWAPIAAFIRSQGALAGIQLAHAGRAASTRRPWEGRGYVDLAEGGWQTVAPSALAYGEWPAPVALDAAGLAKVRDDFVAAAQRSLEAGFELVEIHAAHGYLLHEFLSPLSNERGDACGGTLENRMRFPLSVVAAVRDVWPSELPLLVRISATDWVEGGWHLEESIVFATRLRELGVDLVDVSSGGLDPRQQIPVAPNYQVPFAAAIRREAQIPTGAVGLITEPKQADDLLRAGEADVVLLARQLLREPYWPLRAAAELGVDVEWPVQYLRAK